MLLIDKHGKKPQLLMASTTSKCHRQGRAGVHIRKLEALQSFAGAEKSRTR